MEIAEGVFLALFLFSMFLIVDWVWSGKVLYGDYVEYRRLPFPILMFCIVTIGIVAGSVYFIGVKLIPWLMNNVRFV